jgi:bifunctional non-homologous end joining protein LigD
LFPLEVCIPTVRKKVAAGLGRKTTLERLLARRPEGIFVNPFERGEIGADLVRAACTWALRDWCRSGGIGHIRRAGQSIGSR